MWYCPSRSLPACLRLVAVTNCLLPFDLWSGKHSPIMSRWAALPGLGYLLASLSFAQNPASPHLSTQPDYPKEASVIESYHTAVSYENDGTGTRTIVLRARVQSDAGVQQYGLLQFSYSSTNEEVAIDYVRVQKPDGTVVETPPDNVQDMPAEITQQAPFYTDYREKHVPVKGLGVGDVLEYQVHFRLVKPLIPGQFWYADDFIRTGIVLDEELKIALRSREAGNSQGQARIDRRCARHRSVLCR